jgi:hypothetical protein
MSEVINVFNFSGGKTSAYMTIKHYQKGDLVIFTDTGREHPKTYKFINDFEMYENIPVIRISYKDKKKPFDDIVSEKKKGLPNMFKRWCTNELKIKTCKRYLKSIGIIEFNNYLGIRYDEKERIIKRKKMFKKVHDKFPLNEDKITKEDILFFWSKKPYKLEIPPILGNCTLCFMKGKNAIINILSHYPELAEEWIKDEERTNRTFIDGVKYKDLLNISKLQLKIFDTPLEEIKPAFNCSCTN